MAAVLLIACVIMSSVGPVIGLQKVQIGDRGQLHKSESVDEQVQGGVNFLYQGKVQKRNSSSEHVMGDKLPEGEMPRSSKCAKLRQFRFEQDGRVLAWYNDEPPSELFPAWSKVAGTNWTLRPEVVALLNDFLALQDKTLCRTITTYQRVFVIARMNGLGNAIFGSLTYMVAGILMNPPRAVVLRNWDTSFDDAFNTPLMEYTFEHLRSLDLLSQEVFESPQCSPGHLDVQCFGNSAVDSWMWCSSFDSVFTKRIAHIDGCCGNFIPLFYRNPLYGPKLRKIFGEQELAVPLLRTLFRPSQQIAAKVEAMHKRPYVAAAVRLFNNANAKHLFEAFAFCLKHFLSKPEHQNASIYVAASDRGLVNSLKEHLGNTSAEVWSHEPPGGEAWGSRDSVMMVRDMWTLGQADAFVLTPWSTASQLGGSWGKTIPWELEGNDWAVTGKCHRVLSNEPCTQRGWGGGLDVCPYGTMRPLKYPATLDRRCGNDNEVPAIRQAVEWASPFVEEAVNR